MASERQLYDALEEQNINTFMGELIAEAGDRPICELDFDKAVAAAHGGVDRIKDAAQPLEFDLGDLSGREQEFVADLHASLDAGSVDSRSSIAQRLERSLTPAEREEYRKKSTAEKAKFRLVWAANTVDSFTKRKVESENWKKVDITHAAYMSVSAVLQREGGSKADLAPTLRLVRRCISMGYPFFQWNGFTERFGVLYLTKIKREEFSKAWELHKEANIGTESTTGQSTSMTPALDTPPTPQPAPSPVRTPSKRTQGSSHRANGSAHLKAKATTSLDKSIVAAASKSKNKMIAAEVAAKNLLVYVQQDPRWSWCCAGILVKLQNEVEKMESVKTPFAQHWLSCEVADMKKAFTTEELAMNFMEFSKRSDEVSASQGFWRRLRRFRRTVA